MLFGQIVRERSWLAFMSDCPASGDSTSTVAVILKSWSQLKKKLLAFSPGRYLVTAEQMVMNLLAWPTKLKNKAVILDHTFMHDFGEEHGEDNYRELGRFLRLAKEVGFVFRTLDTFLTDD